MTASITTYRDGFLLGEEAIRKVLRDSGLTEKEAEVYVFLAKHEALKSTEIAKLLKKDKAQIFRILKKLQAKGFAEVALDFPTRYAAASFELVLESVLKSKREEVAFIEKSKSDLLDYVRKKKGSRLDPPLEKFLMISGQKRIYSKMTRIIKETKHQLSVIASVPGLLNADRFGVFDAAFEHPLRSQIQFRFLTELPEQNLNAVKDILRRTTKVIVDFKVKNPDLGLSLFPRMVTRDHEEILFFISPKLNQVEKDDLCLWTNSKSLVQAFSSVFEDLWRNSTDLQEKLSEIETGKLRPKTYVINDWQIAKKKYYKTMQSAEQEIILVTSLEGLAEFLKSESLLKELTNKGVSVKLMAPIVGENIDAAKQLSKICCVRHVAKSYLETTIIDGKHFFQFKPPRTNQQKSNSIPHFENTFYTNNIEYVEKMKTTLNDLWENAHAPFAVTLELILEKTREPFVPLSLNNVYPKFFNKLSDISVEDQRQWGLAKEKDVLSKIINTKRVSNDLQLNSTIAVGSVASAVIHPPDKFKLPDTVITAFHFEKQSSFGEEDAMLIYLWIETPAGPAYVPVAYVGDNPKAQAIWKVWLASSPAGRNIKLVKKDELQIRIHGNTFFAGWTVPIPLLPPKYSLPPACLLIEGFGDLKTDSFTIFSPSGYRTETERNGFEAFVTFFHPESKYSGPGTDGFFARDYFATTYPPSSRKVRN